VAEKRYLLTPGPTEVPPEVLAELAKPVVHHRSPDFRPVFRDCLERLRRVFRADGDVLLMTCSGTGAMESIVANLTESGDRVLVVSAGQFGERWGGIAAAHGCVVDWLRYEWGETPTAADLTARLEELGSVKVVFLTHSETSTGVVCDLAALAAAGRGAGALVAVDAVSSLGAVPLETDAWGLDAVASGSQKALMCPPGLAMVAVSERAWSQRISSRSFYFDWERIRAAQAELDAAFTPAVSLVAALNAALGLLLDRIGLEAAFERHASLGRACREGLKAMGLELFSPDEERAGVVTAAYAPDGIDATELVLTLRDRFGITIANGHAHLKGKIFRIGHIGYYDVFDVTTALGAIELVLTELDAPIERGVAVTRALETYGERARV
jgi:aspartate aminotransferase-like enzyme